MPPPLSYEEYTRNLTRLTPVGDPTVETEEGQRTLEAAASLVALPIIDRASLVRWVGDNPRGVPVLGLVVGLSLEKLKNALRHELGTSGSQTLAKEKPDELIRVLDEVFHLVDLLNSQRHREYEFGDILVARQMPRLTAAAGAASGRSLEDAIEAVANELRLPHAMRTVFIGKDGRTAPCDMAIPDGGADAEIVVAAKGFDSTGSKLTDAVREVNEMADVRLPRQHAMAVIDGIGWLSRAADLRRIYARWADEYIEGMYTLATLDQFRADLDSAATRRGIARTP